MVKKKQVSYYWKVAFFSLLAIIVIGCGIGVYMASQPGDTQVQSNESLTKDDDGIQVSLNRQQATTLISSYLNKTIGKSKIKFDFELGEQAELRGTFDQLPIPVDFSLYFKPIVLENGNIKLKATKLLIGKLHLPIRIILGFIDQTKMLPKIVTIHPKDKEMILNLNQLTFDSGMKVTAKDIDLQNNQLTFNIDLPLDKQNEK